MGDPLVQAFSSSQQGKGQVWILAFIQFLNQKAAHEDHPTKKYPMAKPNVQLKSKLPMATVSILKSDLHRNLEFDIWLWV
jgi:hypothetical protein